MCDPVSFTLCTKWRPFCWRHYQKLVFSLYLLKYSTHLWYQNVYAQVFMVSKQAGVILKCVNIKWINYGKFHTQDSQNADFWCIVILYFHFRKIFCMHVSYTFSIYALHFQWLISMKEMQFPIVTRDLICFVMCFITTSLQSRTGVKKI